MGSGGTLVGNGLYKFHNFHLFVLEATSEIYSTKQLQNRTLKNLYKSSFLVKMKDGLTVNSSVFRFCRTTLSMTVSR